MKLKILAFAFAGALAIASVGGAAMAAPGENNGKKMEKHTICHQTHSETNPFVLINVSMNSNKGHDPFGENPDHTHESGDEVADDGECGGEGEGEGE